MLPIVLPQEDLEALHADALTGEQLEVDLEKQVVRRPGGKGEIPFQVEEFRRHCLLNGLDDIARECQRCESYFKLLQADKCVLSFQSLFNMATTSNSSRSAAPPPGLGSTV
jgi:3-isopropylmalate dehydratase small subunit